MERFQAAAKQPSGWQGTQNQPLLLSLAAFGSQRGCQPTLLGALSLCSQPALRGHRMVHFLSPTQECALVACTSLSWVGVGSEGTKMKDAAIF